jgi:hypothetical protein
MITWVKVFEELKPLLVVLSLLGRITLPSGESLD